MKTHNIYDFLTFVFSDISILNIFFLSNLNIESRQKYSWKIDFQRSIKLINCQNVKVEKSTFCINYGCLVWESDRNKIKCFYRFHTSIIFIYFFCLPLVAYSTFCFNFALIQNKVSNVYKSNIYILPTISLKRRSLNMKIVFDNFLRQIKYFVILLQYKWRLRTIAMKFLWRQQTF